MDKSPPQTSKPFNFASAIFAFCLWGAWAFYINNDADFITRITSGLTQGSASFIITLVMVHSVTWIFNRLNGFVVKLIVPAFITIAFTSSLLFIAHTLVKTPNIIATVSPGLTVAFLFCIFTSYTLSKKHSPTKLYRELI